jgi:hypothetical protein
MGFRLRRRGNGDNGFRSLLERDSTAIAQALDEVADSGDFDLEIATGDVFDNEPTRDIRSLRARGVDGEAFYEDELRPNWDQLSKGERAAKLESFARFANGLGQQDPEGMGAVVRTKLLLLAWAFDHTYADDYTDRLAHQPQRFGRLTLTSAH